MENSNPDSSSNSTLTLFGVSIDSKTPELNNKEKTPVKDVTGISSESIFRRTNNPSCRRLCFQDTRNGDLGYCVKRKTRESDGTGASFAYRNHETNTMKNDGNVEEVSGISSESLFLRPVFLPNIPKRRRFSSPKRITRNDELGHSTNGNPIPTFHFFLEKNREQSHTQITKGIFSPEEDREDRCFGLPTRLELSDHRWKIKKELTVSDTNSLYRLMLGHKTVSENILPFWSAPAVARARSAEGMRVHVRDDDTQTLHEMNFKNWASNDCYIFGRNWKPDFVNRRGLTAGDKVGFFWDAGNSRFCFTVLDRIRVRT